MAVPDESVVLTSGGALPERVVNSILGLLKATSFPAPLIGTTWTIPIQHHDSDFKVSLTYAAYLTSISLPTPILLAVPTAYELYSAPDNVILCHNQEQRNVFKKATKADKKDFALIGKRCFH